MWEYEKYFNELNFKLKLLLRLNSINYVQFCCETAGQMLKQQCQSLTRVGNCSCWLMRKYGSLRIWSEGLTLQNLHGLEYLFWLKILLMSCWRHCCKVFGFALHIELQETILRIKAWVKTADAIDWRKSALWMWRWYAVLEFKWVFIFQNICRRSWHQGVNDSLR